MKIYTQTTGNQSTALLFVHGWQGNNSWWNAQREFFSDKFKVVTMDLPGHGKSEHLNAYSSVSYAQAIKQVADEIEAENIILIGHSMAGAYILEAAPLIARVRALVSVDMIIDLEQTFTYEQAEQFMFSACRKDYKAAVEGFLSKELFSPKSPKEIIEQVQQALLSTEVEHAIAVLSPLYKMNIQTTASKVSVPVRAINADLHPTNAANNRKYIKDFEFEMILNCGHYPMLEKPEEFNKALLKLLQ
jgi:pimeloyl-ACP methyl ester carboxylesterase